MRSNLEASGPFIVTENAMMVLAPALGRTRAHDLLHHAVAVTHRDGGDLVEMLLAEVDVRNSVGERALRAAFDPANYTGRSQAMAREQAAAARQAVAKLRAAEELPQVGFR
jgi:3-carboxy-cis,cis-muconate cycloisomerase